MSGLIVRSVGFDPSPPLSPAPPFFLPSSKILTSFFIRLWSCRSFLSITLLVSTVSFRLESKLGWLPMIFSHSQSIIMPLEFVTPDFFPRLKMALYLYLPLCCSTEWNKSKIHSLTQPTIKSIKKRESEEKNGKAYSFQQQCGSTRKYIPVSSCHPHVGGSINCIRWDLRIDNKVEVVFIWEWVVYIRYNRYSSNKIVMVTMEREWCKGGTERLYKKRRGEGEKGGHLLSKYRSGKVITFHGRYRSNRFPTTYRSLLIGHWHRLLSFPSEDTCTRWSLQPRRLFLIRRW